MHASPARIDRRARDAAEGGARDLGTLPDWDLTDLYASEEAPELARDLDWLGKECAAFAEAYEGRLAELDADGLLACVRRYEKIDMVAGRIMSFAGLRYYQNTTDGARAKFLGDCQQKVTDDTTPLVFFSLEINRIEDEALGQRFAENAELARYKPVFDRLRAMKPYQLSDELEKFLHDNSVVGAAAWNRLFDETMASLEFEIDGDTHSLEAALNFLTEQDRSKREAAARAVAEVFSSNV
ncbi:MAG: oligoendopeptidase F, partial [Paracoccaceae bacterium]|nr:oligoendopeptidase F [Paracoccaceae bacterium]